MNQKIIDNTKILSSLYSVIILNTKNLSKIPYLNALIAHSQEIIVADGAANWCLQSGVIPSIIVGDFDSIEKDTLRHFQQIKQIENKDSQYSDFEKCLTLVSQPKAVIISGLSGRLDHTFNNLNLLYKYSEKFEISLFEEQSLLTIITPGITTYKINTEFEQKKGCGFVCFKENNLKTKGFRWDILQNSSKIIFGSYISSSNEILDEEVIFNCQEILLFTTQLLQKY